MAPLPFRSPRRQLPNNKEQAASRFATLRRTLNKNPEMKEHFFSFMQGMLEDGHAEMAPEIKDDEECWYLPSFGVYHRRKPGEIRVVFDSSAKYQGVSLNDVLLTGPDLTNILVGLLLRFRKERIATMADIRQMFYSFLVKEEDRDYLRFLWYRDNGPNKDVIEHRMRVHVFGNSPSPAVATYGLRRTVQEGERVYGTDARGFVERDFYVDDGLKSLPTEEQAIDLLKRSQAMLATANLKLHKQAIAAVAHLKVVDAQGTCHVGFVLGKAKLAPLPEITIPRLELCAAVLAVEIGDLILNEIDISVHATTFFTDSRIVLGTYTTRLYVVLRVRYEQGGEDSQVFMAGPVALRTDGTESSRPRDAAHRLSQTMWLRGPQFLKKQSDDTTDANTPEYKLVESDVDPEIRAEVATYWTCLEPDLQPEPCRHWHICSEPRTVASVNDARNVILLRVQREAYTEEIACLQKTQNVRRGNPLYKLDPFLDEYGLVRVGSRLRNVDLDRNECTLSSCQAVITSLLCSFVITMKRCGTREDTSLKAPSEHRVSGS
ncbi:uncharacterized protein LOC135371686 [Ornithodoros turicata]|uniref:uncharacterized protein LOC135371686 n=1 Tax=Ornithodoros turicata TaxID=34597 RepID=UPI00313A0570